MQQLVYQLALTQVPGIGDFLTRQLISYCGNAEAVFRIKKSALKRIPGIGEYAADQITRFNGFSRMEQEILFMEKANIRSYFYLDADYPARLKAFDDAPALLFSSGAIDLNPQKVVGIVGTRQATPYGKAFTEELIAGLRPAGAMILSGLAYGIDIHAHKCALENGLPTVGVLAHGLDRVYPYAHRHIAGQMKKNGGLISEFMSKTNPDRENFPRRNRIVAGLCDVLVVVETGIKGGAMITADIADSYNKEIMALPGSIHEPMSKGCNQLIRLNKAAMVTCANELMEWMNWDLDQSHKTAVQPTLFDLPDSDRRLVHYLQQKGRTGIDEIVAELNVDPGTLSLQLLELEIRNIIRNLPGKQFELK